MSPHLSQYMLPLPCFHRCVWWTIPAELRSVLQSRIRSCPFSRSHYQSFPITTQFLILSKEKKPVAPLLLPAKTEKCFTLPGQAFLLTGSCQGSQ